MRNHRHGSLAFLAAVLKLIGIIFIIGGFCQAGVYISLEHANVPLLRLIVNSVASVLRGLVTGVLALAMGQAFLVLLDIEESARRTADALENKRTVPTPKLD